MMGKMMEDTDWDCEVCGHIWIAYENYVRCRESHYDGPHDESAWDRPWNEVIVRFRRRGTIRD